MSTYDERMAMAIECTSHVSFIGGEIERQQVNQAIANLLEKEFARKNELIEKLIDTVNELRGKK